MGEQVGFLGVDPSCSLRQNLKFGLWVLAVWSGRPPSPPLLSLGAWIG